MVIRNIYFSYIDMCINMYVYILYIYHSAQKNYMGKMDGISGEITRKKKKKEKWEMGK